MRRVMLISAGAVCAAGAWWWFKSPRSTPAAVNTSPPGQTSDAGSPLDYLNFDFGALFPKSSAANSAEQKPYIVEGDNMILPKGLKNNNPLNIEAGRDQWQGMTGSDGRFIIFESAFYGIRAAARIMKNYRDKYGLNTVQGIVNRWAPPSDNNPTEKYINFVANRAGVSAQQPLSMADYSKVIAVMIHFENGYNPYDQAEIARATSAGFK